MMNQNLFVNRIKTEVLDSAVDGVLYQLNSPSGRRPDEKLVELSNWYHGLSDSDRSMIKRVAEMSAHHATFGFLSVLDGVRQIEDGGGEGELRLTYETGEQRTLLNDQQAEMLHDILNSIT